MTTQQQIILEEIVKRCDPYRVTIDHQYSNTGYIRLIDDATLLAKRSVSFFFADDHATFKTPAPGGETVATHYYGKARREGHIPAVKSTPIEMIDTVVAYLKGLDT
jgi:hypothetical protein